MSERLDLQPDGPHSGDYTETLPAASSKLCACSEGDGFADTSGDVPAKITDALEGLGAVRAVALTLARELAALQSAMSGLYLPDPDDLES